MTARCARLLVAGAIGFSSSLASANRPLGEVATFGAYAEGLPYYDAAFTELEKKLGAELPIASGFVDWDYLLGEARDVAFSDGGRRTLLYSWEPHCDAGGRCISFRDVIDGKLDSYFERVAASLRKFPHVIYVRPWAEMNAPWSLYLPGSGSPRAGTIEEFKGAWRHLYDYFRGRSVKNLRFVFDIDATDDPGSVPAATLWPGRDPADGHGYVDVLGMDGYNWGESGKPGGDTWREFEDVFRDAYRSLTALDGKAPVWICEFGSKEPEENDGAEKSPAPVDPNHDKGRWFTNMMRSRAFPRVTALVYFSAYLRNESNQRDFRLDSSESSLAAVRAHLKAHPRRAARAR